MVKGVEEKTLRKRGRAFLEQAVADFREISFIFNYNFLKKAFSDHFHRVPYRGF